MTLYILALLGCSLLGGSDDAPRNKRGPKDNNPDTWAVSLQCDSGSATSGNPKNSHPEYWAVFPDCQLPMALDFTGHRKPKGDRRGYPYQTMPKGAAHQWCPPDKKGHQKYMMRVPVSTHGRQTTRYITGRLIDGQPSGTFHMLGDASDPQGPNHLVSGTFRAGVAAEGWSWADNEYQTLCVSAHGEIKNGSPTGRWTARQLDGANLITFEGTYTPAGWQGVRSVSRNTIPPIAIETGTVKDGTLLP